MSEITIDFNEIRGAVELHLNNAWSSLESKLIRRAKIGIISIGYAQAWVEFGINHQENLTLKERDLLHGWYAQVFEVRDEYWKNLNLVHLEGVHEHTPRPAFDARPPAVQPEVKPVSGRPQKPADPAFQKKPRGTTIAGTEHELELLTILEEGRPGECANNDDWFNYVAEEMMKRHGVQTSLFTVRAYWQRERDTAKLRTNGNGAH